MEHSAEVVNVDYKKKIKINGIEARSIIFAENYPREYKTVGGYDIDRFAQ